MLKFADDQLIVKEIRRRRSELWGAEARRGLLKKRIKKKQRENK